MKELSCSFNKMSFITKMDEIGDKKIENEGDLRNVVQ